MNFFTTKNQSTHDNLKWNNTANKTTKRQGKQVLGYGKKQAELYITRPHANMLLVMTVQDNFSVQYFSDLNST